MINGTRSSIWTSRPLGECGKWVSGGTPRKSDASLWNGNIPWFSAKSLKTFDLDDSEDRVTREGAESGSTLVPPGTVLFVVRGMSLANELRVGITSRESTLNQDLRGIIVNKDIDARYLGRFLKHTNAFIDKVDNASHGTKRIQSDKLKEMEIPLPPFSEQRRIADILDKADAIRRNRREIRNCLDNLLQSAFLYRVGPSANGYRSWPKRRIQSLAAAEDRAMRTGPFGSDLRHSEFVDEGIAVLGIDNAVQNRFAWNERRFISQEKYEGLERFTVYPNDVIISIMGTTGRSAVVPEDIPTAITTKHLACITLNRNEAEPEFVSNSIHRHPEVLGQIGASHRGAIMPGLNLTLIKSLELHVPPIEVQRKFTATVQALRTFENQLAEADRRLEDLFNSLVKRAFRGDL